MTISDSARQVIDLHCFRVANIALNPLLSNNLPDKFTLLLPHQVVAVEKILAAFEDVDVVILDAPTGSGKTIIAEVVRLMMKTRATYICSSKSLQDQFINDFWYANLLKGRRNYTPEKRGIELGITCEDCTWLSYKQCRYCSSKRKCPYEIAKQKALQLSLAVLNTSYFLSECNHVGHFSLVHNLVIADEADTLEAQLMNYVSFEISERRARRLQLSPPRKVTVASEWQRWISEEALPAYRRRKLRIPRQTTVKELRELKSLERGIEQLTNIRNSIVDGYWVYTGNDYNISFKPSRVDTLGKKCLWRHGRKWLLMSATIVSGQEIVDSLGWDGRYKVISVPSTFNPYNRQVRYIPVANMSRKTIADGQKKTAECIRRIASRHPNEKMLVHTVSYSLSLYLADSLKGMGREITSYQQASDRDSALDKYLQTRNGILVAPSMDRGIDLVGDACRVQVIAKVPFPNLGDRQISARLHSRDGQVWYNVQTIRTLVQMCGRAVRNSEDHAVTYILDSQFGSQVWSKSRGLFPRWWVDGLQFSPRVI